MKTAWMAWAAVMAAAAMIPLGCSSVAVDPPPTGCPTAAPKAGEKCSAAATGCAYTEGPCEVELSCKAANDVWTSSTGCTPEAVECWSAQEGDVCATVGDACGEADGPCGSGFASTCGEDHHWHIASIGGDCPPPVGDYCTSNGTQATCETDPGCRWLTPGCGDFPLPAPGCFTIAECSQGGASCEPGTMCAQVSFNPCFGSNCDACGAEVSLCLPTKK